MSNINNGLNALSGITSAVSSTATGVGALAGDIASPLGYRDQLQPASYRGVPFQVLSESGRFGRRQAVHTYPKRDKAWAEDMGRKQRSYTITGFLIGDDVLAQRDKLIAATETPGDGTLVHPTYGELQVSLLDFSASVSWDKGRVVTVHFNFMEAGQRIFPAAATSSSDAVTTAATGDNASALASQVQKAAAALKNGAAVVDAAAGKAQGWVDSAKRIVQDATTLYQTVAALPGTLGRYANQAIHGFASGPQSQPTSLDVASLIALGTSARTILSVLGDSLVADAGVPASFGATAQSLAAAVRASVSDPRTAINMLAALAVFPSDAAVLVSPIGSAQSSIKNASADMFRRAAVAEMAAASAAYYPASADDAAAVRTQVCGAIEAELTIAADQGEDDVYLSLRQLYAAVAKDLADKGSGLPEVVTITSAAPQPSLVLAQRLYQDVTREGELVLEADPIHPAFMPTSFKGLSA
jgi:prophage DNA circulation protein